MKSKKETTGIPAPQAKRKPIFRVTERKRSYRVEQLMGDYYFPLDGIIYSSEKVAREKAQDMADKVVSGDWKPLK